MNFFDACDVVVDESYIQKFYDVIDDDFDDDLPELIDFYINPLPLGYILEIDVLRNEIKMQKKFIPFNIISPTNLQIRHTFLQPVIYNLYRLLKPHPKIFETIFSEFYNYMYQPILNSVTVSLDMNQQYISEIELNLLEEYGIDTTNFIYFKH